MDREAWRAAIHGVAKSRTRLSDWTELNWYIHKNIHTLFSFYKSFYWNIVDLQCCVTFCYTAKWFVICTSVQFSRSVVSNSLWPHESARQASLSITNSRSSLRLKSIELVMPSSHHTYIYNFKTVNQFYWHFKCLLKYCPRVWNRPIKSNFWAEVRAKRWNFSF